MDELPQRPRNGAPSPVGGGGLPFVGMRTRVHPAWNAECDLWRNGRVDSPRVFIHDDDDVTVVVVVVAGFDGRDFVGCTVLVRLDSGRPLNIPGLGIITAARG